MKIEFLVIISVPQITLTKLENNRWEIHTQTAYKNVHHVNGLINKRENNRSLPQWWPSGSIAWQCMNKDSDMKVDAGQVSALSMIGCTSIHARIVLLIWEWSEEELQAKRSPYLRRCLSILCRGYFLIPSFKEQSAFVKNVQSFRIY